MNTSWCHLSLIACSVAALVVPTTAAPIGSVVEWGGYTMPLVPPGTRFIAVAAGGVHNLALKDDGNVLAWEHNGYAQCAVPEGLTNVIAIAAGDLHSLALKSDGTVVAWGQNYFRQISVPHGLTNMVAVAGGLQHSLALRSDGTVTGWGSNLDPA